MQCLSSIILSPLNNNVKMSFHEQGDSHVESKRVATSGSHFPMRARLFGVCQSRGAARPIALRSAREGELVQLKRISPRLAGRSRPTAHRPWLAGRCLRQNPRSRILLLANSSIPAREGFFCAIRHTFFRGIAGVVGFPDGRTSLELVWRACGALRLACSSHYALRERR